MLVSRRGGSKTVSNSMGCPLSMALGH